MPPMALLEPDEDGNLEINLENLSKLKSIPKKAQVIWSIGRNKTNNTHLFNYFKKKWFCEKGMEENKQGLWVWISNHWYNQSMTLVLIDFDPLGSFHPKNNIHVLEMICILSGTLLWNIDAKNDEYEEDISIFFDKLHELKKAFKTIQPKRSKNHLCGTSIKCIAYGSNNDLSESKKGKKKDILDILFPETSNWSKVKSAVNPFGKTKKKSKEERKFFEEIVLKRAKESFKSFFSRQQFIPVPSINEDMKSCYDTKMENLEENLLGKAEPDQFCGVAISVCQWAHLFHYYWIKRGTCALDKLLIEMKDGIHNGIVNLVLESFRQKLAATTTDIMNSEERLNQYFYNTIAKRNIDIDVVYLDDIRAEGKTKLKIDYTKKIVSEVNNPNNDLEYLQAHFSGKTGSGIPPVELVIKQEQEEKRLRLNPIVEKIINFWIQKKGHFNLSSASVITTIGLPVDAKRALYDNFLNCNKSFYFYPVKDVPYIWIGNLATSSDNAIDKFVVIVDIPSIETVDENCFLSLLPLLLLISNSFVVSFSEYSKFKKIMGTDGVKPNSDADHDIVSTYFLKRRKKKSTFPTLLLWSPGKQNSKPRVFLNLIHSFDRTEEVSDFAGMSPSCLEKMQKCTIESLETELNLKIVLDLFHRFIEDLPPINGSKIDRNDHDHFTKGEEFVVSILPDDYKDYLNKALEYYEKLSEPEGINDNNKLKETESLESVKNDMMEEIEGDVGAKNIGSLILQKILESEIPKINEQNREKMKKLEFEYCVGELTTLYASKREMFKKTEDKDYRLEFKRFLRDLDDLTRKESIIEKVSEESWNSAKEYFKESTVMLLFQIIYYAYFQ